jgi:hypothetical protein
MFDTFYVIFDRSPTPLASTLISLITMAILRAEEAIHAKEVCQVKGALQTKEVTQAEEGRPAERARLAEADQDHGHRTIPLSSVDGSTLMRTARAP